jgi:nicotinamide-nucleotide amidase
VAESCTGGALGAALTAVPGASTVFVGGVIAYSDRVKIDVLGVSESTIRACGAVSSEVAQSMALGVRRVTSADWAVSITGVAGPEGGTPEKPVGTVWIGLEGPGGDASETRLWRFPGDRDAVRASCVHAALDMLFRAAEDGIA